MYDKSQILAGLPQFTAFLVTLVADPNFKIALSSMQIMDLLACKTGSDIEPQLRCALAPHRSSLFQGSYRCGQPHTVEAVVTTGSANQACDALLPL